jgi:hypothetical protein
VVKNFVSYRIWSFITVFSAAHHWTLSRGTSIHFKSWHHISFRATVIQSEHKRNFPFASALGIFLKSLAPELNWDSFGSTVIEQLPWMANCSTHKLLCCAVVFETSGNQPRCATITRSVSNKIYRLISFLHNSGSVGKATGYGLDAQGLIRSKGKIFLFLIAPRPFVRPNRPPIQWVPGVDFSGDKEAGTWNRPLNFV